MAGAYQILDEALERIADAAPDLRTGLTNHAPMAIEALCAMDRSEAIAGWLERYRSSFLPRPARLAEIDPGRWAESLGKTNHFSDWRELMLDELRMKSWQAVLREWIPRLAAGFCASATHGVLRTAHAARALRIEDTARRRAELADGLAYWAAQWQALPGRIAPDAASDDPREAIARVATVPNERRRFTGTITSSLAALDDFAEFADVINLARFPDDPGAAISSLTQTFARVYLANTRDVLTTIVFIHAVTSTTALRSLIGHVEAEDAKTLLRYAWQCGCALYATFGATPRPTEMIRAPRTSREELIDRAVENGDEHVIKFTEACLREHAINPAQDYLAAAHHTWRMIGRA